MERSDGKNNPEAADGQERAAAAEEQETGGQERAGAEEADEERGRQDDSRRQAEARLTYIQDLERRLHESQNTLTEYIAAFKQVQQDKEDFKRRLEREKSKELDILRGKLVEDLLELMDNLDRSVQGAERGRNFDALHTGIRMVQHQFVEKLEHLGVKTVPTVGHPFNPVQHEALDIAPVEGPEDDGKVLVEYSRGFTMNDRVIRPARVKVGRYDG